MTRIVEKTYLSTNGTAARLWYSTHTGNGTVYFTFADGTKAHENVNLYGDENHMRLFGAEDVLNDKYDIIKEVRKG